MGCGGGHGGHMFSNEPDKKVPKSESSWVVVVIFPFLISVVIFCSIVIFNIGTR